MQRSYINELKSGKEVLLKGWVYEIRDLAKLRFLLLRDITGVVQCIIKDSDLIKKYSNISLESVIEIKGKVNKANVKSELARKDVEIEVIDLSENFAEKFRALVMRKNIAIRDIYDIYFILKNNILKMTNDVGIFQHANFKQPNLEEGYTTCDNSRCLILSTALENFQQTDDKIKN